MSESKAVKKTTKKRTKKAVVAKKNIPELKKNRWLLHSVLKLLLAIVIGLIIYVIYLDAKVQRKFEGQRWQIPIQVYGKITELHQHQIIKLQEISAQLVLAGYKKVTQVKEAGQFAQSAHRLIVYRRSFDFGFGDEPATRITINEKRGKINYILQDKQQVNSVKLEPVLLDRIVPENNEDRILVSLEEVPEKLIDTLLLVEDRNFYFHHGVAPLGILRALFANIRAGRTVQGGSTLTQQLVKNMFLTRERTIIRKINEALMALILEYRYSKDQLLEAYLNEVYLGQNFGDGIYGFGLAAKFYFGKSLAQLSDEQIALLVAQIKGPSFYDPWRHPLRAKKRRDLVLNLMFEKNLLARQAYIAAIDSPLTIRASRRLRQQSYPAYLQVVKQELTQLLPDLAQQSGIRIFTGFSALSQQYLTATVAKRLTELEQKYQIKELQAAMVVVDINSGEIRAIIGDRNTSYAGFNRALTAKRPVGSLIKPAIYLAALERYENYNLATLLADKPIKIPDGTGKVWQPKNYDGKYSGRVNLLNALTHSLNVPTVNLGLSLGLKQVRNTINVLGYNKQIPLRPSMLLGSLSMSPLEVSQLYQAIAAQGKYRSQHTIIEVLDKDNQVLWQAPAVTEQRLSHSGSYLINYALEKVVEQGTAKSLTWRLPKHKIAGKTGTTNQLRDSWFVGYDAKHLVTTWVGRDDNKPSKLTGSSGALVLFADYMHQQGIDDQQLIMPNEVSLFWFEQKTGNAVTEECSDIVQYPAVSKGIVVQKNCLKKREKKRSWLEKLFGL
jgi:penicillin-binding protein 1B